MHGVLLDERPFQDPAHPEMMQMPAAQLLDHPCCLGLQKMEHALTAMTYTQGCKASTMFSQRKKYRLQQFSQSDS